MSQDTELGILTLVDFQSGNRDSESRERSQAASAGSGELSASIGEVARTGAADYQVLLEVADL
jgi:hypothetical protein